MTLPNFFIVGAPKAGTDELYYDLDQHPEIYMSPLKEPCFFSSEVRIENMHPSLRERSQLSAASLRRYLDEGMRGKRFGGMISEWDDYLRLFSRATNEKAVGEGSVSYLWSKSAPFAIASAIPHARIIIVLMDPAERAFHQYLKSISDETVGHSFQEHLKLALKASRQEMSVYHPFLAFGNYAEEVQRYLTAFPPEQLSISFYEEAKSNHAAWFSNLLDFLGVDNRFVPQPVEVPSKPHVPRFVGTSRALPLRTLKKRAAALLPASIKPFARQLVYRESLPRLDPEDRSILVGYYREDILRLQDLLGRDLSSWLR